MSHDPRDTDLYRAKLRIVENALADNPTAQRAFASLVEDLVIARIDVEQDWAFFDAFTAEPCTRCGGKRNWRLDGQLQAVCHACGNPTGYNGPWVAAMIECEVCHGRHASVHPAVAPKVECSFCGHMNPAPPVEGGA